MPFSDYVIERREAVYRCDQCNVIEQRAYDSPPYFDSPWKAVSWEHDWRFVPSYWLAQRMGVPSLAFCSEECLVAHHDAIEKAAYGKSEITIT